MFLILETKKYKAYLDNLRFANGLTFDLTFINPKNDKKLTLKDINLKLNLWSLIIDLITKKQLKEQIIDNIIGAIDITYKNLNKEATNGKI